MNTLRPDELANESRIEKAQQRDINLKRGLKTVATVAGGAIGSRIAPFLSELIPADLAIKGINKISPKLGQALDQGMKQGLNVKDGLNFIKENLMGGSEQKEPPKQDRNIIEQYSPELFQFLQGEIQKGNSVMKAGALAHATGKFKKEINKLEKDHKSSFSAILQTVFGEGEGMQVRKAPSQQQQQSNQSSQGNLPSYIQDEIDRRFNQAQKMGIVDEVVNKSKQRKVSKVIANDIAKKLNIPLNEAQEYVTGVKTKLGIPSMDDKEEFEAWLQGNNMQARQQIQQPQQSQQQGPSAGQQQLMDAINRLRQIRGG